ncbi:unnamed protein product [Nezara viridula]|uniref:Uncharacterized protein n=1 Tax=Nezara viridula TaxID=85310 RepID=A0A9P0MVL2_NEZVI|nr:unnamed protein product [Nezara viridula]
MASSRLRFGPALSFTSYTPSTLNQFPSSPDTVLDTDPRDIDPTDRYSSTRRCWPKSRDPELVIVVLIPVTPSEGAVFVTGCRFLAPRRIIRAVNFITAASTSKQLSSLSLRFHFFLRRFDLPLQSSRFHFDIVMTVTSGIFFSIT